MSYTRTDPFNPLFNRSQYTSMLRKSTVTHVTAHVRLQIILNKSTVDQIPSISTTSSSLNSLFRVLFIFPSRYLFAIGLSSMFSLRWSIPPLFKLHSQATWLLTECVLACLHSASDNAYGSLTLSAVLFQACFTIFKLPQGKLVSAYYAHPSLSHYIFVLYSHNTNSRLGLWCLSFSFAITKEIMVIFFSSTY